MTYDRISTNAKGMPWNASDPRRPFIYHIRPRIFCPGIDAKLIELRIEGLGLRLKADDLRTGRPYPNKAYKVGCRKMGRKSVDGILLNLSAWPSDFEVQAHWAISAEYVARHKVVYTLLDEEFGAASDDMMLWYAYGRIDHPVKDISEVPLKFQNRFPNWAKDIPPCNAEPLMEVYPRQPSEHDLFDHKGRLVERSEVFALPTIEPERFLGTEYPRERIHMPTLEMAITL